MEEHPAGKTDGRDIRNRRVVISGCTQKGGDCLKRQPPPFVVSYWYLGHYDLRFDLSLEQSGFLTGLGIDTHHYEAERVGAGLPSAFR